MTRELPSAHARGLFMGSGGGLAEPGMAELVVELSGRAADGLELLYLGTATYDRAAPRERQSARFAELGCHVRALDIATRDATAGDLEEAVGRADVVLVSGGNTLYAVDRWVALGLDEMLREGIDRGLVACGGSAGAICWFDGGHSDSMDPTSYLAPVPAEDPRASDWRYIRVDGLGIVPGLLCPHYEATQSNGILRASDFEAMMRRHPGETGLGLDSWAGLLIDGDRYQVVHPDGRPGSVGAHEFVSDGSGVPGLWLHDVVDGEVEVALAPTHGRLVDIVRPAREVVDDARISAAREENPPRSDSSIRRYPRVVMAATPNPQHIRYRKTSPPGAGQYEVLYEDTVIGKVARYQMGAGQFGSRWIGTTPRRKKSAKYMTRDAAAMWLVEQAHAGRTAK